MKHLLKLGGSERGYSWYTKLLSCPKSMWFSEQRAEGPEIYPGKAETGKLNAALVGTLFHGYLEEVSRGWDGTDASLDFFQEDVRLAGYHDEELEAYRLFVAYSQRFGTREFIPYAIEVDLRDESGSLGVPLLTGRADLVISWPGGRIDGTNGLYLREGLYIVDHKTDASTPSNLAAEYEIQMWVYLYLWNLQFPKTPVLGGILNDVIKTKEPKFIREFILCPSEEQIAAIRGTLEHAWSLYSKRETLRIVSDRTCMGKYSPCGFRKECLI
jgi:hypothetical protein